MEQADAMERRTMRTGTARVAPALRHPWPRLAFATAVAASLVAAFALAGTARAATYKWVDEKGVIHYTDKIPPEAVNKGSTVLDKQARPTRRIDPALTPEQRLKHEAEEEQKRIAAKAQEEIARRDRALVSSYTNEVEIDLARSRALATIDAQLESSHAYVASLDKRKVQLDKRRAALGDAPVPQALERELEGNLSELAKTAALIEQKRKERTAAVARYDADKARWRELKSVADFNAGAVPARAASADAPARPASAGANGAGKL
jgi:hypothetical protein